MHYPSQAMCHTTTAARKDLEGPVPHFFNLSTINVVIIKEAGNLNSPVCK
jgi:hypothetical protein